MGSEKLWEEGFFFGWYWDDWYLLEICVGRLMKWGGLHVVSF